MTHAGRTTLLCAAVIAIGVALTFLRSAAQPQYAGHAAKYWFEILAAPQASVGKAAIDDSVNRRKAWDALAGETNMIPFLVHQFIDADSFHAKVQMWVYDHVPSGFHKVLPEPLYANHRQLASRLLHGNFYAILYLAHTLPAGSSATRGLALEALRFYAGTNDAPYVPEITACLSDRDAMVRGSALLILTSIGPSASNAIPKLLQMLAQTNKPIDPAAAYAVWPSHEREPARASR